MWKPAKNPTATSGAGISSVWIADIINRVWGIELSPLDITQLGVALASAAHWLPWRTTEDRDRPGRDDDEK